jgi:hypothetical protein
MKDQTMTDPIDHDEILKEFAPPTPIDESKLLTSPWAVASFVLGLVGLPLVAGLGAYVAILAIVAGHVGRREIRNGLRAGRGWATAGLILGYSTFALLTLGRLIVNFS